jgi:metal-responsive CopG/Arc/MetJ family transcriptional regulator
MEDVPVASRRARKVRVTATLDRDMVEALDRAAKRHRLGSRSQALEAALKHWLREQRQREIDREIEAYYRSLTPSEKREERQWARFSSRVAARLWD